MPLAVVFEPEVRLDPFIPGPFSEGACEAVRGDTFGELPIAVGQGKFFGAMPPIESVHSCACACSNNGRHKKRGGEDDAG